MQPAPASPPPPAAAAAVVKEEEEQQQPHHEEDEDGAASPAVGEEEHKEVEAEAEEEEEEEQEVEVEKRVRRGRGRKRGRRSGGGGGSSSSAAASRGVVMVKREVLARCMTCPLCNRLLRDATTVSECLHTFCRKCIYEKFNDEEVESCPVCKIDLGCTPVEKLRADHNIQDVRSKIFPFKRKKIRAEEVAAPILLPSKRKERSISSLVVDTPTVTPTGLTGRRTRAVTRKAAALRGLGLGIDDPVKKEIDNSEKHAQNSSLPTNSGKVPQTRRQMSSNAEASNRSSNKDTEGGRKEVADKTDELWRPLNCLVEAANRTKSLRSSSQSQIVKKEQLSDSPGSTSFNKTKSREHVHKSQIEDDKKDVPLLKRKNQRTGRRRELHAPSDSKPDAAATQNERKFTSIWFSLVASFEQEGDPPLPQIPSHYLRIKDGNIPASSIQKYLMKKLGLPSEAEVEINCCGQPVSPTQSLCNLVELWLRRQSTETTQTMIGTPAKEFVMVLTYGRPKAITP
uniref:RING-type domain-containing protein n=1 Tax=Leersia perrieri TaxID=77586 RepID=A0A0D9VWK2_9ORYZ